MEDQTSVSTVSQDPPTPQESTEDVPPVVETVPGRASDDFYRRRRRRLTSGAAILGALLLMFVLSRTTDPAPAVADQPSDAAEVVTATGSPQGFLDVELDRAAEYRGAQKLEKTFVGFSTTAFAATSKHTIVMSATVDGVCVYGGIIAGNRVDTLVDGSGQACTPEAIAEQQSFLAAEQLDEQAAASAAAGQALTRAVKAAEYYAASNVIDGSPSFEGLTSVSVDGVDVEVVNGDPHQLILRAGDGDACVAVLLSSTGGQPVLGRC